MDEYSGASLLPSPCLFGLLLTPLTPDAQCDQSRLIPNIDIRVALLAPTPIIILDHRDGRAKLIQCNLFIIHRITHQSVPSSVRYTSA